MKNLFLLLGLALSQMGYSQDHFTKEFINTDVFDDTEMPAVLYNLNKVKLESFKKTWKNELDHNTKEDVIVTEYQVIAEGVMNAEVSNIPYNVYSNFKSIEGGVEFIVSIKDSAGVIDLQNNVRQVEINTYLDAFVTRIYVKSLNDELNAQKSELKRLNNEVDKTEGAIVKKEKQNMKLKAQIEQAEQQIVANDGQYEAVLSALQAKRTELAGTNKKSEEYNSVKKEAKGLEKNKKKMESEKIDLGEDIYDWKATIETNASLVNEMEESLLLLDLKIQDQKAIVVGIEEELYKLNRP